MSIAFWTVALACLAGTVAFLAVRARHAAAVAIPLADGAARRRTRALRLLLATAAVAGALALAPATRTSTPGQQLLPTDSTAMIVLDLSDSTTAYFTEIAGTLDSLTRESNRRLGLVVVSNTAYVALPPTTPVEGLRGWLRAFVRSPLLDYPWKGTFSQGTELSKGLVTAEAAVRQAHVKNPHVVLVTDLSDDPFDLQRLSAIVSEYQRERIDLRIVSLGENRTALAPTGAPNWHNAAYIARAATTLARPTRADGVATHRPGLLAVALLLGLVALTLTAYEARFHPLRWRALP